MADPVDITTLYGVGPSHEAVITYDPDTKTITLDHADDKPSIAFHLTDHTVREIARAAELWGDASETGARLEWTLGEDLEGQVLIYTGYYPKET